MIFLIQCTFDTGKACELWITLLVQLITHYKNAILIQSSTKSQYCLYVASIITISLTPGHFLKKKPKKVIFN